MVVEADGHRDVVRVAVILSERRIALVRAFTPEDTTSDVLSALDTWADLPERTKALAAQIERAIATKGRDRSGPLSDERLRRAILAGFPDRVAQRRAPLSPRVVIASGTGGTLTSDSGVRQAEFIVALDVQASTRTDEPDSRIRIASAVEREWLVPTSTDLEYRIDERGVVKAREVDRYDALRLADRPVPPDPARAAELLAAEWLKRPIPPAAQTLLRRLRFAGVEVDLPSLVRDAAARATALNDIDLASALPHAVTHDLATHAPHTLRVPSGRQIALEYAEDGTVTASVKLQELFGLEDTPRIGRRSEPVLLSLLAPNGRPVQMTRDLRSFWNRTYPEVRKELRGRYPRHPWPEDPWSATPTHRTKPRP
jgi:ATP-dependent helicase HrpB